MEIRLALATGADYLEVDVDGPAFPTALHAAGIDARRVVWDAPRDWTEFDAVLLRATWDYTEKLAAFLAWTRRPRCLLNAADLVAWNADKRYLGELARAGLPVVPTRYVEPGSAVTAAYGTAYGARDSTAYGAGYGTAYGTAYGVGGAATIGAWPDDCEEIVVKPAVSASARDTGRFRVGDPAADALVAAIHRRGGVAMVQPYLPYVDVDGEGSLVYFGGRYSHAARKAAILVPAARTPGAEPPPRPGDDADPHPGLALIDPDPAQRTLADAVLAHLRTHHEEPVYARVDILPTASGPVILEVELIEPDLWLHALGAPERFAAAVRDRLTGR